MLVTPHLISMRDFAFRGRLVSLQSTAKSTYIHEIYLHPHNEKIRTIQRSDLSSTNILLYQTRVFYKQKRSASLVYGKIIRVGIFFIFNSLLLRNNFPFAQINRRKMCISFKGFFNMRNIKSVCNV